MVPASLLPLFALLKLIAAQDGVNLSEGAAALRTAVCSKGYSVSCLKLDLLGVVARAGGGGRYQLLPGVFLSHNLTASPPAGQLVRAVNDGNATEDVESYISNTINDYLSSLTLSVKVLDSNTVGHARKLSEQILTSIVPMETGRKKGYGGALWAAGTLAAVGMAALAAVSGKAMMTSMLALMMAGATALRGGNGGGNGGGGGGHGCKSAHIIDAHARAIELERLAAVEPMEVYSQPRPVYTTGSGGRPHATLSIPAR